MRMSQPAPRGQANTAPWRRWLLPAAVTAGFVTLLALSGGAARGMPLTYTQFVADVGGPHRLLARTRRNNPPAG